LSGSSKKINSYGHESQEGIRLVHKNIWVLVEKKDRKIHPVSFELLSKGRTLKKELCESLIAVLPGDAEKNDISMLEQYGADEILLIHADRDASGSCETMAELICMAVEEEKPQVILAGATIYGRTLMPLIAVQLKTGLTADCTELSIDKDRKILLQTRPAFGGNIMATIECAGSRPQMATVRPRVFRMEKKQESIKARVVSKNYSPGIRRAARILETAVRAESLDISQAEAIVSGGRGLGKPEGFDLISELSDKIGGMTGASRGAVDLGWISQAHQVGQTGHTVSPKLYIACGISGAVQHLAGMKGSGTIIAVNEDPDAPIFEAADYGIVGDLYDIIPGILKELERGEIV
jgi:electron transfer flavoprotein alpha subunit